MGDTLRLKDNAQGDKEPRNIKPIVHVRTCCNRFPYQKKKKEKIRKDRRSIIKRVDNFSAEKNVKSSG